MNSLDAARFVFPLTLTTSQTHLIHCECVGMTRRMAKESKAKWQLFSSHLQIAFIDCHAKITQQWQEKIKEREREREFNVNLLKRNFAALGFNISNKSFEAKRMKRIEMK